MSEAKNEFSDNLIIKKKKKSWINEPAPPSPLPIASVSLKTQN